MRPIATEHSIIRYPLNHILGSEANVRLLRTFVLETESPLGASDAARLTGLTPAGARKALERLVECGVIERSGSGRTVQYALYRARPLVKALAVLFTHEQRHCDSLIAALKSTIARLPEVSAAWLETLPTTASDPVRIDVIVETEAMPWMGEELRTRFAPIEQDCNLMIETALYTRADERVPGPQAVFLRSLNNASGARSRQQPPLSHAEMEERSLHMTEGLIDIMRSDPSLIPRAKRHLDRLLQEDHGMASGDIAEWRQLLQTYSPQSIMKLLVSRSSRADRLRQSSPFFAVLTAEEREGLMASLEDQP